MLPIEFLLLKFPNCKIKMLNYRENIEVIKPPPPLILK